MPTPVTPDEQSDWTDSSELPGGGIVVRGHTRDASFLAGCAVLTAKFTRHELNAGVPSKSVALQCHEGRWPALRSGTPNTDKCAKPVCGLADLSSGKIRCAGGIDVCFTIRRRDGAVSGWQGSAATQQLACRCENR
jgi:hypothetical protein